MSDATASSRSELKGATATPKETIYESIASFVQFFIVLLITTRFFLPLFQIPTGSMAETLYGAHGQTTCPNCGFAFPVNCDGGVNSFTITIPSLTECPNCWFRQPTRANPSPGGVPIARVNPAAGDRIVIHGWIYDLPFNIANVMAPQRWDVVVFKYPPDPTNNFIKRLIGLPGETVEIVDGDIFINGRIERKPEPAQRALWTPVYHHDYIPARQAAAEYAPRWVAQNATAWKRMDTRVPMFDGLDQPRQELLFVTNPRSDDEPGWIVDKNGYNGPLIPIHGIHIAPYHVQSDVRLSAVVEIESGSGFVELELTKYDVTFRLRLAADGAWMVESRHNESGAGSGTEFSKLSSGTITAVRGRAVPIALAIADYQVSAELDGGRVFASTDQQYSVALDIARERSLHPQRPRVVIAAERVVARVARIVIHRDVFYTNDVAPPGRELHAGLGSPFSLDEDDYFVLGDNSRASSDARVWDEVGPHLRDAYAAGRHRPGTIPRDQLLGRAFFVYWPGVRSLAGRFPILPDVGNIRWIR